jgi:hypothetical protein
MGLFNWKNTVREVVGDLENEARKADLEGDQAVSKMLRIVARIVIVRFLS